MEPLQRLGMGWEVQTKQEGLSHGLPRYKQNSTLCSNGQIPISKQRRIWMRKRFIIEIHMGTSLVVKVKTLPSNTEVQVNSW